MTTPELRVLGFELARISEAYLNRLADLMRPHGLDRYFAPFLWISQNSGSITQKDLGEILKRDKVHTTRIVDHLCDCGLVSRVIDPNDRRCHILETTSKAKDLLPKVHQAVREVNAFLLCEFDHQGKLQFEKNLNVVFQHIDQLPRPEYIVKAVKNRPD